MKKMLKKLGAFSITLALLVGVAGCGASNSSSGSTAGTSSSAVASADKVDEPYQLDLYMYDNGKMSDVAAVEAKLTELVKERINCTVKITLLDGATYADKFNLAISSKAKMDLVNPAFGGKYPYLATNGAYLALDDYLKGEYKDLYDLVGPEFVDGTKINGSTYAIPVLKEKGETNGYVLNAQLVDKYGFDISTIKKYSDIEPMLKIIHENEPGITPLVMSNTNCKNLINIENEPLFYNKVIGYITKNTTDYKITSAFENESVMDVYRWANKMYKAGYVNKDALTDTDTDGPATEYKFFAKGSNLKPGFAEEKEAYYGGKVYTVDLQKGYMPYNQSVGSMMGIPSTSENPDKAMAFINLLYKDAEVLNTVVYGVEGTHFVKSGDTIKYPDGVTADSNKWANWGWAYGNQFINYIFEGEKADKYTQFESFNASLEISPILGFSPDITELNDIYNACVSVDLKYSQALGCGALDPDENKDKIQKELDAAGYQTLKTELQKQLDEWVKANK